VLDLGADATDKEIKAAYHTLVKVWHPDRFQNDETLKVAAEAKLKNVNSAYAFLSSAAGKSVRWERTAPAHASAAPQEPPARTPPPRPSSRRQPAANQPTAERPHASKGARARGRRAGASSWVFPALKFGFGITLVAFALLMARYSWIAFDVEGSPSGVADVIGGSKDSLLWFLKGPKRRFLAAVEQDLRRLDPRRPAPGVLPQAAKISPATASQSRQTVSAKVIGQPQAKVQATPLRLYSYITVGSTRDEVIAQQGAPTSSSGNKLVYGGSELYLKEGSVIGWRIDPTSPIRVKLWPEASVDTSLDSFSVGSSKDAVLVVQGTPTAFSEDKFEYGGSAVYFRNNRVVSWKNDASSIPLRARAD